MKSRSIALRARFCAPILLIALAGCSASDATPTPSPAPTATTLVLPADDAAAIGAPTTLGSLADRIAAAWPTATSMRWTYVTIGADYAADGAVASDQVLQAFTYVNEVDADGNRRMTILSGDVVAGQLVAIDGAIWAWGLLPIPAAAISAPDAAGWVAVTPEAALADPQGGQLVTSILAPVAPILANMAAADRALAAVPIAPQPFGPRTCPTWRSESVVDGTAVTTIVGIDDAGLVCGYSVSYSGQTSILVWTFGDAITIAPPDGTPVPPAP